LERRIPGTLSIGFPYADSGALIRSLSRIGVSVSAGSACSSKKIQTSHVLAAIGADTEKYATIRFSFGLKTDDEDLNYLFKYLPKILELIRKQEHIA
jgi:cysteine desulfurase